MAGLTGLQARKNRRNPSFFRREREVSVPGLGGLRNEKEELHTFLGMAGGASKVVLAGYWLEQISERGYRLMSEERLIPVSTTACD